jgi:hypothetical protein
MFSFSILTILMWAAIAVGCLVIGREVGKLLFKGQKGVTGLRKATQDLAIAMRAHGLTKVPEVLEAVTVGDVDDLLNAIQNAATIVRSGNAAIIAELEGTFDKMLNMKLSTPEGRAAMKARLEAAEKIALEVAKAATPIVAKALLTAI